MGNNPASSVISGSDFFKENESRFSDDDDDEVASVMTTRTITKAQQQRASRAASRASNFTINSMASPNKHRSHSVQPQTPNVSNVSVASTPFYYQRSNTRKAINQSRLNETFYENLTEASSADSKVLVESLPHDALQWLQNAGLSVSSPFAAATSTQLKPLPPPPRPPPPPPPRQEVQLVVWDSPHVILNRRVRDLGIAQVDPSVYSRKYGETLVAASHLPAIVKNIRPQNGAILAAEADSQSSSFASRGIRLIGDVGALSLLKKYYSQLNGNGQRRRNSVALF